MLEIKEPVKKIAGFLSFFAKARMYSPIDKLARPFSYDDVVRAIEDALRQAKVLKDQVIEREGKRVIEVRTGVYVEEPYIPSSTTLTEFLELCKNDLIYAREAAVLALAYGG